MRRKSAVHATRRDNGLSWLALPTLLLTTLVFASATLTDAGAVETRTTAIAAKLPDKEALMARARATASLLTGVEGYYAAQVAPLERVLRRQGADEKLARRIAVALVREGHKVGVDPKLLTGMLLVENPALDTMARSMVGASGLMQIMPLHRGRWGCGAPMSAVDVNICYGARIFASNLRSSGGNVEQALLRYNGCVRGTNTPNCHDYPYHVYTRVSRVNSIASRAPTRAAAP